MRRISIAFRLAAVVVIALALSFSSSSQQTPPCPNCPVWNAPQAPFRIFGNIWYVGPHGLTTILITSDSGHVLIDGGLPESVPQILAHIRSLGFRIEDVKLIVNTHVHFDHAGGIAELQRASGARVAASEWSAAVLKKGGVSPDDPQSGVIAGIAPVANVETLQDGQTFRVGPLELTAHLTPGHTPGGTSWTWKSCEADRCLDIVFSDSLTAVSADAYKFTDHPRLVHAFDSSYAFLRATPCDILLTTHPDASNFWDRRAAEVASANAQAATKLIDPAACRQLAERAQAQLQDRLATEKK